MGPNGKLGVREPHKQNDVCASWEFDRIGKLLEVVLVPSITLHDWLVLSQALATPAPMFRT